MSDAKRLVRLYRAQAAVAAGAEADARAAEAEHKAALDTGVELLSALGSDHVLHGLLIPTMARSLNANTREAERLRAAAARDAETAKAQRALADAIHKRARAARADERKGAARRSFEAVGMDAAARSRART